MQIVWITKVIACDIDRAEVLLKIEPLTSELENLQVALRQS